MLVGFLSLTLLKRRYPALLGGAPAATAAAIATGAETVRQVETERT